MDRKTTSRQSISSLMLTAPLTEYSDFYDGEKVYKIYRGNRNLFINAANLKNLTNSFSANHFRD